MIRQKMKVLVMIGVLLHFVAAADQAREAKQSSYGKIPLSEQFVRSLSVIKGSDRRALQLQNIESATLGLAAETQRVAGLTRRMQKQRTMQRRKPRFRGRKRSSSGGRGVGHGKWRPAGWNGSSGRNRNGKWQSSEKHRSGGSGYGRKPDKPTSGWGSPWGQGWGGRVHKPGHSPSKPVKTFYPTYYEPPVPKPSPRPTHKPEPQVPTFHPTDGSDMRLIQVTMDGMLTAIELDVPAEGSQDLQTLAKVFQQTIRRFLGEEYRIDVYQIGGESVNNNSIQNDKEKGSNKDGNKKPGPSDNKNNLDASKKKGDEKRSKKDNNMKSDPSKENNRSDPSKKKDNEKRSKEDDNIKSDSSKRKDNEKKSKEDDNVKSDPPDEDNKSNSSKKRKQRKGLPRELQAGSGYEQGWAEWDTSFWEKNEVTSWGPGLTECPVDDTQVPVFFELKVIRRCFNCDDEKAFTKGAETFRETFAVLDDAVQSGDMSRSFCMNALRAGIVTTYPCEVSITCVMGISFSDQFVDEIVNSLPPTPSLPDTYEPTHYPTGEFPTFTPTQEPTPNEFFPTVEPTLEPTSLEPPPTPEPTDEATDIEPTPKPTYEPTDIEPTPKPTYEPTEIEPTPKPTYEPTEIEPTPEPTPGVTDFEPTPEPTLELTSEPTPVDTGTQNPTPFPTALQESPTFQPTVTEGTPLFIFGSSESVGNTGTSDYDVPFDVGEDVIYASAGSGYTLVILDDESVAVAGFIDNIDNYSGYFGLPQQDLFEGSNELATIDSVVNIDGKTRSAPKFRRVQAGVKTNDDTMHSAFIDVNGNVYAAGSNNNGQLCLGDLDDRDIPHQIDLGEDAVAVAVGGDFTLILGASGDVYGCGSNEFGQLGLGNVLFVDVPDSGNGVRDVRSISAGLDFSLLSTEDGLVVMGSNSEQQLCTDEFDEVSEPFFLDAIGSDETRQFRAGSQSSYILFRDGSIAACGLNDFGQLGIGNVDDPGPATVQIPGENFIKTLGVGPSADSAFFVGVDGTAYGAGRNNRGQLGVGDKNDRDSPEQVLFEFNGDDVTRISAASDHTLAW